MDMRHLGVPKSRLSNNVVIQMKNCNIFLIFAQNIDCGYTLEPPQYEYPQSRFWSKNKKKVYPCKPQFYYIKVGCKGVFDTRTCFRNVTMTLSAEIWRLGCSETSVTIDIIQNIWKTSKVS